MYIAEAALFKIHFASKPFDGTFHASVKLGSNPQLLYSINVLVLLVGWFYTTDFRRMLQSF